MFILLDSLISSNVFERRSHAEGDKNGIGGGLLVAISSISHFEEKL